MLLALLFSLSIECCSKRENMLKNDVRDERFAKGEQIDFEMNILV